MFNRIRRIDRKRAGALLLAVGMALVLFVSSAFLLHEAGHDCCGEGCPVCQLIAVQASLLRAVALVLLFSGVLLLSGCRGFLRPMHRASLLPASGTLVSWKIRLDD